MERAAMFSSSVSPFWLGFVGGTAKQIAIAISFGILLHLWGRSKFCCS
jgi:hypothetical protein